MDDVVIGIDGGGTTVRVVAASAATGQTLAQAQQAASGDGGPDLDCSLGQVLGALGGAPSTVRAVCAGVAKITRDEVKARWEAELVRRFAGARVDVVADYVIAFSGATEGVGLAVVAGTGSVVYGEDGRGGAVRVGGRGWEYGDEGSGAWLTSEAIRRTLRVLDGTSAPTPLGDAVCRFLGTRDPAELAAQARRQAEQGRGFLVPLLLERADRGDTEASNLFVGAAGWLGLQAKAAAARLVFEPGEPLIVATAGGLWEAGEWLLRPFDQVVRRWLPCARIVRARTAPVEGAVRRARACYEAENGRVDKRPGHAVH